MHLVRRLYTHTIGTNSSEGDDDSECGGAEQHNGWPKLRLGSPGASPVAHDGLCGEVGVEDEGLGDDAIAGEAEGCEAD